jgi:23S rRNA (cytidine1920-2'-O)/16S rRNA (cytidine1409-2'-O)-methyltransferase
MNKVRLDVVILARRLLFSRSQAENYIKLGLIKVNGLVATKASQLVSPEDKIEVTTDQYVSRAAFKLESVAKTLGLDFRNKVVLDVGSSTGGFTDYALRQGASKVIAVDVGTDQLHPSLRDDPRIELHEKTDIRDFTQNQTILGRVDVVVIDVSFISLRNILPSIAKAVGQGTQIVAMVKPQFESATQQKNKGVVKNERIRRDILKDFENWTQKLFIILDKADSEVAGAKGNQERFYLLKKLK